MPFIDPFRTNKTLTDTNLLKVNISQFLGLPDKPELFYEAIRDLIHMREGLRVAEQGGLGQQLEPGRNAYRNELLWLKLEAPINEGVAVSQIMSHDDLNNESIAVSFHQQVQWAKQNYFLNNPTYQQIQTQLGIAKVARLQKLDIQASELEQDFLASLQDSQNGLATAVEQQKQAIYDELTSRFNEQINQITNSGTDAVDKIEQARALQTWNDYYEENVRLYETALSGMEWQKVHFTRRWHNLVSQIRGRFQNLRNYTPDPERMKRAWTGYIFSRSAMLAPYLIRGALDLLWRIAEYLLRKLFSIKGRRLVWFTVLGGVLIGQAVFFFFAITSPHGHGVFSSNLNVLLQKDFTLAKISAFLGFILVPSLGYASVNRNYRIYSNLLEQYRHRATVARTLQGVLLQFTENDDNKDVRQSLVSVAAAAMFELKAVGHLSKTDGSGTPLSEVLQMLLGSRH